MTLRSTATRDFRPIIGGADFARLAFVLLLVVALVSLKPSLQIAARVRVIRI